MRRREEEGGEGDVHVQPIRILYPTRETRGLFGDRPVLQAARFRGTTSGPGRFFHFFRQQPLAPHWMTSHVHPPSGFGLLHFYRRFIHT